MTHFNSNLKNNPLNSRDDFVQALADLIDPVYQLMADEHTPGRVRISDSGSVYDEPRREVEGFLRTLWGIGPLCNTEARAQKYAKSYTPATAGILAGCDPSSPYYWGQLEDYDQLFVEMGSLATFLIMTQDFFYNKLDTKDQQNIYTWLDQINHHTIPKTNWLFFRVLVNSFFQRAGLVLPTDQPQADLQELDTYYLKDGWYFDGYNTQIDYYIPFGMQYYGVLYTALAADSNEKHVQLFAQRARQFGKTFKNWFAKNGTALPFGRSQTYRFAQSAFWAVSAYTNTTLDELTLGESKYLLTENMHQWFKLPIFTSDNFLSIGYGYPNLVFAEGYNAPGSPYWAMKNFIVLALPDDDPYWTTPKTAPEFPQKSVNPYAHMLLVRGDHDNELQAFTAGQHSHEHAHGDDKYEKYVYSTTFGFSVKKGNVLPKQGAYDNTLALSDTEYNFKTAFGYRDYQVHPDYVYSRWEPWEDVTVDNFIIPCYPWHIRIHVVNTGRTLNILEGSFSAPNGGQAISYPDKSGAIYTSAVGTVGIVDLSNQYSVELSEPEPNTNVFYPKTVLPLISGQLDPGKHILLTACLGDAHHTTNIEQPISAKLEGNTVHIKINNQVITVPLDELAH